MNSYTANQKRLTLWSRTSSSRITLDIFRSWKHRRRKRADRIPLLEILWLPPLSQKVVRIPKLCKRISTILSSMIRNDLHWYIRTIHYLVGRTPATFASPRSRFCFDSCMNLWYLTNQLEISLPISENENELKNVFQRRPDIWIRNCFQLILLIKIPNAFNEMLPLHLI